MCKIPGTAIELGIKIFKGESFGDSPFIIQIFSLHFSNIESPTTTNELLAKMIKLNPKQQEHILFLIDDIINASKK